MKYRRILGIVLLVFLLVALGGFAAKRGADSGFYDRYEPGQPTAYDIIDSEDTEKYRREYFTFLGDGDTKVPAYAAYPLEGDGPFPCVIMLYGIGQKMTFIDDIAEYFAEAGYVLVMPEQHHRGERKPAKLSDLDAALGLRERAALTVMEARRLVDTMETSANIDSDRIFLWGLSYGAICSAPALAKEPRFRAGVFTVGGGNLGETFRNTDSLDDLGMMRPVALFAVTSLLRPLEPTWYIAGASPRPVLFQNATQDQIIPREAAEALHEAAAEPKTIIWYDTTHEGNDGKEVPRMLREGIAWLNDVSAE